MLFYWFSQQAAATDLRPPRGGDNPLAIRELTQNTVTASAGEWAWTGSRGKLI